MISDKYGVPVTQDRWDKVDAAIKGFIMRHPVEWMEFKKELATDRSEYQLANEGDLRKASFRKVLSFPVVGRYRTPEEVEEDPGHGPIEYGENLKKELDVLIPGFTDAGENVENNGKEYKPNKLFFEFIKRYKNLFVAGEKY